MVPFTYVWETVDFLETDEFCEVKVGTYSHINEYMTIYDYSRSRSFIDHCPRSLRFNFFNLKPQGWLKQNFMESPWEVGNENLFRVTWPCPYMIKNFKNLLFLNQETGDLKTWYTALGSWLPSIFSNDDPGLTWTTFMTGSNLFPNASIWVTAYTALSAHV